MGVKGDNLELISGLLLSSFILNYMLIRVKERGLKKKNRKNREREKNDQERGRRTIEGEEKRRGKQSLGKFACWITNSSVEVGYGLCYFVVKLLIANDMYWVIL